MQKLDCQFAADDSYLISHDVTMRCKNQQDCVFTHEQTQQMAAHAGGIS